MIKYVFKNEFMRTIKYKKKLILNFLLPILSVILAIIINLFMKPEMNLGIVNGNKLSEDFIAKCKNINNIYVENSDNKSIKTDILLGQYDAVIDFLNKDNIRVLCKDKNMSLKIENSIKEFIGNRSVVGVREFLYDKEKSQISVEDRTISFMFIIICIICTLLYNNLIIDKDSGVLNRISISPNNYWEYLLGKYFFYYVFSILQCLIIVCISYLFDLNISISLINYIRMILTIPLISSAIAFLSVCICSNEITSGALVSIITILLSLVGGAFMPLKTLPKLLLKLSDFSIVNWIINLEKLQNVILIIIVSSLLIVLSVLIGKNKFQNIK